MAGQRVYTRTQAATITEPYAKKSHITHARIMSAYPLIDNDLNVKDPEPQIQIKTKEPNTLRYHKVHTTFA
jgi:hypothetical protein